MPIARYGVIWALLGTSVLCCACNTPNNSSPAPHTGEARRTMCSADGGVLEGVAPPKELLEGVDGGRLQGVPPPKELLEPPLRGVAPPADFQGVLCGPPAYEPPPESGSEPAVCSDARCECQPQGGSAIPSPGRCYPDQCAAMAANVTYRYCAIDVGDPERCVEKTRTVQNVSCGKPPCGRTAVTFLEVVAGSCGWVSHETDPSRRWCQGTLRKVTRTFTCDRQGGRDGWAFADTCAMNEVRNECEGQCSYTKRIAAEDCRPGDTILGTCKKARAPPACMNARDDDGDGLTDSSDPGCTTPYDGQEASCHDCDDGDRCTTDMCNECTGACEHTPTWGPGCPPTSTGGSGAGCGVAGCDPGDPQECGPDCTPTTAMPEVSVGDQYLDADPDGRVWLYQETNGISGLQRKDENVDNTCCGLIAADTLVF